MDRITRRDPWVGVRDATGTARGRTREKCDSRTNAKKSGPPEKKGGPYKGEGKKADNERTRQECDPQTNAKASGPPEKKGGPYEGVSAIVSLAGRLRHNGGGLRQPG